MSNPENYTNFTWPDAEIYQWILKDLISVVKDSSKGADAKINQIAAILKTNVDDDGQIRDPHVSEEAQGE